MGDAAGPLDERFVAAKRVELRPEDDARLLENFVHVGWVGQDRPDVGVNLPLVPAVKPHKFALRGGFALGCVRQDQSRCVNWSDETTAPESIAAAGRIPEPKNAKNWEISQHSKRATLRVRSPRFEVGG